jgi:hypothetical protein
MRLWEVSPKALTRVNGKMPNLPADRASSIDNGRQFRPSTPLPQPEPSTAVARPPSTKVSSGAAGDDHGVAGEELPRGSPAANVSRKQRGRATKRRTSHRSCGTCASISSATTTPSSPRSAGPCRSCSSSPGARLSGSVRRRSALGEGRHQRSERWLPCLRGLALTTVESRHSRTFVASTFGAKGFDRNLARRLPESAPSTAWLA